jgi:mono/diheme cytochrome c family protein
MRTRSIAIFVVLLTALTWFGCHSAKTGQAAGADTLAHADSSAVLSVLVPADSSTYEQRQGRFLFVKYCAVCHGEQGKGDGFNAFNLNPKPRDFTDTSAMKMLSDERIRQTIAGGGRSVNKSQLMPSWEGTIARQEIGYLVSYVRTFSSKSGVSNHASTDR